MQNPSASEKSIYLAIAQVAEGSPLPAEWRNDPQRVQALVVAACSPSNNANASNMRVRLNALNALANQGVSINGEEGTTTPLHAACKAGAIDLVSALVTFGANPSVKDATGKKPAELIPPESPYRDDLSKMLNTAQLRMAAYGAIHDTNQKLDAGEAPPWLEKAFKKARSKMTA